MDFETLPVVVLVSGSVLLYSAIKNKNPLGVIKAALSGGDLSKVPALFSPSTANDGSHSTGSGGAIDGGAAASVDSLGVGPAIDKILPGDLGSLVILPYKGHPIGSHAGDPDVPGFMGGIDGKNSSYGRDDKRYSVDANGKPYTVSGKPPANYNVPFNNYGVTT